MVAHSDLRAAILKRSQRINTLLVGLRGLDQQETAHEQFLQEMRDSHKRDLAILQESLAGALAYREGILQGQRLRRVHIAARHMHGVLLAEESGKSQGDTMKLRMKDAFRWTANGSDTV